MAKTIVGLFDTAAEAQNVVQRLMNGGFSRDSISVLANNSEGYPARESSPAAAGASTGP